MLKIGDLKVGMRVRLHEKLPVNADEVVCGWVDGSMKKFLGKELTIHKIFSCTVQFDEDADKFYWDIRLIDMKPRVFANVEAMKGLINTGAIQRRIPQGTKIEKIILNNRAIICFAEYENRKYKVVAKCHEDDDFSLQTGMELIAYKLMNKISTYALKEFNK